MSDYLINPFMVVPVTPAVTTRDAVVAGSSGVVAVTDSGSREAMTAAGVQVSRSS